MFVLINNKNLSTKEFTSYEALHEWGLKTCTEELFEWCSWKVYEPIPGGVILYILINNQRFEIKPFTSFEAMKEWWMTLPNRVAIDWINWTNCENKEDLWTCLVRR